MTPLNLCYTCKNLNSLTVHKAVCKALLTQSLDALTSRSTAIDSHPTTATFPARQTAHNTLSCCDPTWSCLSPETTTSTAFPGVPAVPTLSQPPALIAA